MTLFPKHLSTAFLMLCTPFAANADLNVRFIESAPKDSFVVTNAGNCDIPAQTLVLDLSSSAAGLIFDVTDQGAGVEVFQPLEFVQGQNLVHKASAPADGDQTLELHLTAMAPNETVRLTIDLDDTLPKGELGQIRVSGSEIKGAQVIQTIGSAAAIAGQFDDKGRASIATAPCQS